MEFFTPKNEDWRAAGDVDDPGVAFGFRPGGLALKTP
jgi:hypothetical protein